MTRRRGLFVVLEGPDKSGKSTQASMLRDSLEALGLGVVHTREPGGTAIAESIRQILLNPELHVAPLAELFLYEASRAQHVADKILPALKAKKVVVCERFTMSTDVYQGVARGLKLSVTKALNDYATDGLKADLTIVLDIPPSEFDNRDTARVLDRLERETIAFRKKVASGYRTLAKTRPNTLLLDGRRQPADLHAEIMSRVRRLLK